MVFRICFISVSVNLDASRIGARASNSLSESDTGSWGGGSGARGAMKRTARWCHEWRLQRTNYPRWQRAQPYQILGTISVARTIGSPGLHPNAAANSAIVQHG